MSEDSKETAKKGKYDKNILSSGHDTYVSVCPYCYACVTSVETDTKNRYKFWCPRCKETVVPKTMSLLERKCLNVNILRKKKYELGLNKINNR